VPATDFDTLTRDWLGHLAHELRLSPKTLEAFGRDLTVRLGIAAIA
jgi:integrase/recombinase XerC